MCLPPHGESWSHAYSLTIQIKHKRPHTHTSQKCFFNLQLVAEFSAPLFLHQFDINCAVIFFRLDHNFHISLNTKLGPIKRAQLHTVNKWSGIYHKQILFTNNNEPPSNVSRAASDRGITLHLHVYENLIHIPLLFSSKPKVKLKPCVNSDLRKQQKIKKKCIICIKSHILI